MGQIGIEMRCWRVKWQAETPSIVHINQVIMGQEKLLDYHMLIIPGGFSYGDDLGAGVLWALDLRERFGDVLKQFVDEGRPVFGDMRWLPDIGEIWNIAQIVHRLVR